MARFRAQIALAVSSLALMAGQAGAERPDFQLDRSLASPPPRQKAHASAVPEGYHVEERPRDRLRWTGQIMFLSAWGTDVAIGFAFLSCSPSGDPDQSDYSEQCSAAHSWGKLYFVPVVAPLYVGSRMVFEDTGSKFGWVSLATGTAQLVGAGLWLASALLGPERLAVPDDSAVDASAVLAPASFGPGSAGLSMSGTF